MLIKTNFETLDRNLCCNQNLCRSTAASSSTTPDPESIDISTSSGNKRQQLRRQTPVGPAGRHGHQHEGVELGEAEEDRGGEAGGGADPQPGPSLPYLVRAGC